MKISTIVGYCALATLFVSSLGILMYVVYLERRALSDAVESLSQKAQVIRNAEISLHDEILSIYQAEEYRCVIGEESGSFVLVTCKNVFMASSTVYALMKTSIKGLEKMKIVHGFQLICEFAYKRTAKHFEMTSCKVYKGTSA